MALVTSFITIYLLLVLNIRTSKANDDTVTTSVPATSSAYALKMAKSEAAEADLQFFLDFLLDFDSDVAHYTSYMKEHNLKLPQAVANYYYHLAGIPSSIDLASDIAETFPFSEFQTFITVFPWYSSLLSEASASTIYLPEYFLQAQTAVNSSVTATDSNSSYSTSSTITTSIATTFSTNSTTTNANTRSHQQTSADNAGRFSNLCPLLFFAAYGILL